MGIFLLFSIGDVICDINCAECFQVGLEFLPNVLMFHMRVMNHWRVYAPSQSYCGRSVFAWLLPEVCSSGKS